MAGWVKIKRRLKEWEWYNDSHMVHMLIHMILNANHEEKSWRGITIRRGQFISSRDKIAQDTGISPQSVRTCIERLKSTNEISTKPTNHYTLYTIVNYDKYQAEEISANQQSTSQLTNEQPATNQQSTTTKNYKNYKNEKKRKIIDSIVAENSLFPDLPKTEVEGKLKPETDVTLAELSIEHVKHWLADKRAKGIYRNHDEHLILERFKDYCAAKAPKYKNYVAAYRGAFEWASSKPKGGLPEVGKGQMMKERFLANRKREEFEKQKLAGTKYE